MDTRQLRAFLTVIDTGGISAAADLLGYAQSSVSDQLRGLERDLGVRVLDRTSVGTVPTEAGSRLLPYARQLLDLDGEMRRTVIGARPQLRIGALQSLADEWLPDVLTAFANGAGGPGTGAEIALTVASRDRLAAELAAGRLDAAFTLDSGPPAVGPVAVVGHDRVVLVAAPEHPLASVHPVTLDLLRQVDFLVTEPGCIYRQLFDELGRDVGPSLQIGMITGSLNALRRLAVLGRGAALLPRFAIAPELEAGDLVLLDLPAGLAEVVIEARWRPGLGAAEQPLQALVRLAQRYSPAPSLTAQAS